MWEACRCDLQVTWIPPVYGPHGWALSTLNPEGLLWSELSLPTSLLLPLSSQGDMRGCLHDLKDLL